MKCQATVIGLALVAAGVAAATPAHAAAPVEQETYEGTFSSEQCGGAYVVTTEFRDRVTVRDATPSTDGQFFKFSVRYNFTETYSNPATGDLITVEGKGVLVEIQPRALGDGVFEYVANDAGHFIFRDSEGNAILRESGSIATRYVFDSENDSTPGGITLSEDLVRVSGPHATFPDICDYLAEVLPT
ncbi:hypothetical protein [Mycetocola sp. 2940]|uniref:hypothetical protein n=1 Tax=Mycetocola sp. 2940 TaxID=3156452 RepID=UPI00339B0A22